MATAAGAVLSEHDLKIAPWTYHEHMDKAPTARQRRKEYLLGEIRRVHAENYGVRISDVHHSRGLDRPCE